MKELPSAAQKNQTEFFGTLCNLYMIVILVVIPLYTGGTYYQLGDRKYQIFYNVSLVCLGLWLVFTVGAALLRCLHKSRKEIFAAAKKGVKKFCGNPVDLSMLIYGAVVLLSAFFSNYGNTAWMGYRDWHMGAVSQILFVGIYFLVSRNYDGSVYPLYLGELALFLITLLGIGNRLGWDPLGLYAPFRETDWEYCNMLSTVGNINWLCSYLGVMLAFPVAGYLNSQKKGKSAAFFLISALGLMLLVVQGSDIGVWMAAACVIICLLAGCFPLYRHRFRTFFKRGMALLAAVMVLLTAMGWLAGLRGTLRMIPSDSFLQGSLSHIGPWAAGAILLCGISILLWLLPASMEKPAEKAVLVMGFLTVTAGGIWYLVRSPQGDFWGSGRGVLWSAAWKGFLEAGFLQKLLGAGPDCFAEYLYAIMPAQEIYRGGGHWGRAIFANAHNEWFNQLVNVGLLGTAAYLGIFVCAWKRYRGMILGVLGILLYLINSLTGFQQVMNAPLLFLVLGLCENRVRKE